MASACMCARCYAYPVAVHAWGLGNLPVAGTDERRCLERAQPHKKSQGHKGARANEVSAQYKTLSNRQPAARPQCEKTRIASPHNEYAAATPAAATASTATAAAGGAEGASAGAEAA
ncbi:uncharacterized protein LOC113146698, partial [Cyclospora cayetanensis]|uniref:Uncharacterized protein LOC113146698 n=1 Tax=Cyclospora cayetanensis TaxID=88456 RepID=A0A6P6RSY5_9EIME